MTTLRQLSEQILRRYKGTINSETKLSLREIDIMVNQIAQQIFVEKYRARAMDPDLGDAFDIPASMIMTFINQSLTGDDYSTWVELPVTPIDLPMQMGVWRVYDPEDPSMVFIPIHNVAEAVFQSTPVEAMEGLPGYSVRGTKLYFNDNVDIDEVPQVTMELIVKDFSSIDAETDNYPIPPEMENEIIQLALNQLQNREKNIDETIDNRDQA